MQCTQLHHIGAGIGVKAGGEETKLGLIDKAGD